MGKRSKARSTASEELSVDSNKNKKIKFVDNDDSTNDGILPSKKKTTQTKTVNKAQKSKKIIFNDDEPVESDPVESTSKTEDLSNKQKRKKAKEPLENEEDVKDEDIDKFCEEINEKDNEQYESWVQLIEAKLNSNKKKTK